MTKNIVTEVRRECKAEVVGNGKEGRTIRLCRI